MRHCTPEIIGQQDFMGDELWMLDDGITSVPRIA
jgi:hypothetical protein